MDHCDEFDIVNIKNATVKYENTDYVPDCIVIAGNPGSFHEELASYECHGRTYTNITMLSDSCYIVWP